MDYNDIAVWIPECEASSTELVEHSAVVVSVRGTAGTRVPFVGSQAHSGEKTRLDSFVNGTDTIFNYYRSSRRAFD